MKIIVQLSGLLAESLQISYIRLTAGGSLGWSGSGQGLQEHRVYRRSGHRGSPASLSQLPLPCDTFPSPGLPVLFLPCETLGCPFRHAQRHSQMVIYHYVTKYPKL